MNVRTWLARAAALLLGCAGCQNADVNEAPAARTPRLVSISAVAGRSCAWTTFRIARSGAFELLPSSHPSGDLRVVFRAPFPSRIEIDIAGRFVLSDVERSTDRDQGYYRVDSVEAAPDGDDYVWNVTVTPPTAARLLPAFELRIRDVSIHPRHAGIDKRSAPLALAVARRPVADVQRWLDEHPNVRDALRWNGSGYAQWSAADKQLLRVAFELAWVGSALPLPDALPNRAVFGAAAAPLTVLSSGHAKSLFFAQAAAGLAAEIAAWTSWSIATYPPEQLERLFDSRKTYKWNGRWSGFELPRDEGAQTVVLGSPETALRFLYDNALFTCRDRQEVIARAFAWAHANLDAPAQASRPHGSIATLIGPQPRAAGCAGTIAFLQAVLRPANVPVTVETLRATAVWSQIGAKVDSAGGCARLRLP
jgi:hypothetical protein